MASRKGSGVRNSDNPRKTRRGLRYFYLNGKLHKVLVVNRPADRVVAWNFPDRCRSTYVFSDVKRHMQMAFDLSEAARMIGRTREHVERCILAGAIPQPQKIHKFDGTFEETKYKLSEDDVLALHEYFSQVHVGRPRKDGLVKPGKMPTKAELRAMMRHNQVYYVKNAAGEMVPVWQEVDWE